jgi:hypothetical protein
VFVPRSRPAGGWRGLPRAWRPRTGRPHPPGHKFINVQRTILRTEAPTATLNSAGAAAIILAPHGGVTWYPHQAIVFCSTNPTYQVFVQIYVGGANGVTTVLLASSFSGSGDTLDLPGGPIPPGDALIANFSTGQPGATVSVRYEGVQDVLA